MNKLNILLVIRINKTREDGNYSFTFSPPLTTKPSTGA